MKDKLEGKVYMCSWNDNTQEGVSFMLTPSHKITMTYDRLAELNKKLKAVPAKIFFVCSTTAPTNDFMKQMFDLMVMYEQIQSGQVQVIEEE